MNAPSERSSWVQQAGQFLAARSRRERVLLGVGAGVLLVALLLSLGILPAWRMLQTAPQERARLEAQWQHMQGLQAQSAALQKLPRREYNEAALRASLATLGPTARLQLGPQGAELQLQGTPPDALAAWLLKSRTEAGAVVREAHLERASQDGQPVWNGRLALALAPR